MVFKKIATLFIFTVGFLLFANDTFASTLSLSPGRGEIGVGVIRSVAVRLNTQGEAVNGVSAYLSYPQDKLEVAWITYGSSFAIAAEGTHGGGVIKISRGNISGVTGNVTVATIGFRGKALGSATVAFIGGSAAPRAVDSSDSLNLGASAGGIFNVVPASQVSVTSTADKIGPKISEIKVTDISTNSATINWKTDERSDSVVEYGLENSRYFLSANNPSLVTDHSITITSPLFIPGGVYHFVIKSTDSASNVSTSDDQQFQLQGYQVKIKVVSSTNQPLANAQVLLYNSNQTLSTNELGEVLFENASSGENLIIVKSDTQEKTQQIKILEDDSLQPFTIQMDPVIKASTTARMQPMIIWVGGAILLITVVMILAIIFIKKRRAQSMSNPIRIDNSNPF